MNNRNLLYIGTTQIHASGRTEQGQRRIGHHKPVLKDATFDKFKRVGSISCIKNSFVIHIIKYSLAENVHGIRTIID